MFVIRPRLDREIRLKTLMARPLRLDIPGGWYHVINRGLEKRQIFPDEHANQHFLDLVSKLPERFAVKIHGYVLMGTHYHLQIETQNADLSQAMQWLNVSYSTWYNRLHHRGGHLFGGRFKSILHDPETAALPINRYIHLNPVRVSSPGNPAGSAELVERPNRDLIKIRVAALNDPWSSYNVYVGKARNPGWITVDSIYRFFGDHTLNSLRGAYRRQLEEMAALGQWETDWKEAVTASVLLGSETFVRETTKLLKEQRHEQIGLRETDRHSIDWPAICAAVSEVWKGDWTELSTARGNGALPAAWYLARNFSAMRLGELGRAAGDASYPAVSAAISRFEKRLKIDRELQKKLKATRVLLKI
jgi:putative transposase